ncbi:hypothetical protein E8E13_000603 [Curvularia kusanoi]|uniref:DUF7607 domain-containing protein n=1 Tax=Curvularia kusanoi TaxID=90978 RepID=A0A9P4TAW7_CURKU|nr:hypothetical protein E8E13_000603 [Curvularia kusanoi]
MSPPHPTSAMHSLNLSDQNASKPARRDDEPTLDSRKRKRLTPVHLASEQLPRKATPRSIQPSSAFNLEVPTNSGAWDHLNKWNTAHDTIIGGTDDEEDEEDYCSDASSESALLGDEPENGDEEARFSAEQSRTKGNKLTTGDVLRIIQGCIETFEQAWTPGKGETKRKNETSEVEVPVVYDPLAMWEQAEADGRRNELVTKYELEGDYYRQYLDKLCDEIMKDPGTTEAKVKLLCENLEITVDNIQRAAWLEEIYRLSPERTSDDESQDTASGIADGVRPPPNSLPQSFGHPAPSQIVDLGTPSDSESDSSDEALPTSIISARAVPTRRDRSTTSNTHAGISISEPVIVDSVETMNTPAGLAAGVHLGSLGDAPEQSSISTVTRWSWAHLEETQDRKRAVSKAIHELNPIDRENIRQRLQKVGRANMIREIPACIDMLSCGATRMRGVLPQDLGKILTFTRLFLCWWLCGNYLQNAAPKADLLELQGCLQHDASDLSIFCDYVDTVLQTTFSVDALSYPTRPSQAEIIEISDDDEPCNTRNGTQTI